MSRCFPFPPPGYVRKKGTTNDLDLLKKEKHKEKKHKKEKRDKEKKENKDKRKKEKSEGNDREKKDKKERRGEKAKDKEKDDDKDKHRNGITVEDENKLSWKPVVHAGEILGQNSFSNDGKASGKVFGNSEDTLDQDNHHLVKDTQFFKSVQALGRKLGNEEKELVQNFMGTDQKKEEKTVVRLFTKDLSNGPEAMVKSRGGIDGPGSKVMLESNGNTILPIFPGFDQGIYEGKTDLIGKSINRKAEGKPKTTKKQRDDKHGEKDREKKSKGKDKKSEKEKKKEVRYDEKTREQDKPKVEKNGYTGICSANMPAFVKDVDMTSDIQGHLRKRKDLGETGVFLGSGQVPDVPDGAAHRHLHPDTNISPIKLPCSPCILSSHRMVQAIDPWQTPLSSGPLSTNLVVDEKKLKVNGMIEGQPVTSSLSKLVPTTSKKEGKPVTSSLSELVSKNGMIDGQLVTSSSSKPVSKPKKITPHPDAKYLEEVLSVPKMEEWSEFDDQEWITRGSEIKKPRIDNESPPQEVWDKGVLIDSADVYALPYVIPY